MRIFYVIVGMVLALSICGHAQTLKCPAGQHTAKFCWSGDFGLSGCSREKCVADDTPTCPEYQHVSHSCPSAGPNDACIDVTGHCEDDLHVLTEREWIEIDLQRRMMAEEIRELKDRLKALESKQEQPK